MSEQERREAQIRAWMAEQGLDALLLRRVSSFAWATCGASSYINTATDYGEGMLLYTPGARYVLSNNIEAPRLREEEGLGGQGWEFLTYDWFGQSDAVARVTRGMSLGADGPFAEAVDVSSEVSRLRSLLSPEEGERFRELGALCAEAMSAAIRQVRPGQSEHEIAGLLAGETASRGAWPTVALVATDDRIFKYRHPLPTAKTLDRYAMLVLCGRKHGLICSITRLVHFDALSDELRAKQEHVAAIDALYLAATRPGERLQDVFARAVQGYTEAGYPDEWRLHHQGGPAGYEPREGLGTPTAIGTVVEGQAYAWNPSITGVKSEDTFLVGADHNEVITRIPDWPSIEVEVEGQTVHRPAILRMD